MNVRRGASLLVVFSCLALAVVHLRAEQTRSASQVLRLESEWMKLRSELWSVQARVARARAPDRIRDRATYLATGLVPPGSKDAFESVESPRLATTVTPKRVRPAKSNSSASHTRSTRSEQ